MVTCDTVARDDATGKLTIINTLVGYTVAAFPATLPPFAVYLAMSEIHLLTPLKIYVVNTLDEIMFETEKSFVSAPHPMALVEHVMRFKGVVIPAAGDYFLRLTAADQYIMESRLGIRAAKKEFPE